MRRGVWLVEARRRNDSDDAWEVVPIVIHMKAEGANADVTRANTSSTTEFRARLYVPAPERKRKR